MRKSERHSSSASSGVPTTTLGVSPTERRKASYSDTFMYSWTSICSTAQRASSPALGLL
jgi:hypothetical protein